MERKALAEMLLELLEQETGEQYPQLNDSTDLRQEFKLDSVDMVSLIMHIENRLKISIETQDLERISNVGTLLDVLQAKLAGSSDRQAA